MEEIDEATKMVKDLDSKLAGELNGRAAAIMGEFQANKADWQLRLSELNGVINAKADEAWTKKLEEQIRSEVEQLRKGGGKGISARALEAKLRALRQKMAEIGGMTQTGSAAFSCIACGRPLPDPGQWQDPGDGTRTIFARAVCASFMHANLSHAWFLANRWRLAQ